MTISSVSEVANTTSAKHDFSISPIPDSQEQTRDLRDSLNQGYERHILGISSPTFVRQTHEQRTLGSVDNSGDIAHIDDELVREIAAVIDLFSHPPVARQLHALDISSTSSVRWAFQRNMSPDICPGQSASFSRSSSFAATPMHTVYAHNPMQNACMLHHSLTQSDAQQFAPESSGSRLVYPVHTMSGDYPHMETGDTMHAVPCVNTWAMPGHMMSNAALRYPQIQGPIPTSVLAFGSMSPPPADPSFITLPHSLHNDPPRPSLNPTSPVDNANTMNSSEQASLGFTRYFGPDQNCTNIHYRHDVPFQPPDRGKRGSHESHRHTRTIRPIEPPYARSLAKTRRQSRRAVPHEGNSKNFSKCEEYGQMFSGKYHKTNRSRQIRTNHATNPRDYICTQQDCDHFYKP